MFGDFFLQCLAGAMVARLPTEQEAVGSSPTSGCLKMGFSSLVAVLSWFPVFLSLSWGRGFDPRVGLLFLSSPASSVGRAQDS